MTIPPHQMCSYWVHSPPLMQINADYGVLLVLITRPGTHTQGRVTPPRRRRCYFYAVAGEMENGCLSTGGSYPADG
jgi:hypothetical protein